MATSPVSGNSDESLLIDALHEIHDGQLDAALASIETVLQIRPNFRLTQLVYADILLAKSGAIPGLDRGVSRPLQLPGLREEAQKRLQHDLYRPPRNTLPKERLVLSLEQRRALVIDVSTSRMFLFENRDGDVVLVDDFYASTGKKVR